MDASLDDLAVGRGLQPFHGEHETGTVGDSGTNQMPTRPSGLVERRNALDHSRSEWKTCLFGCETAAGPRLGCGGGFGATLDRNRRYDHGHHQFLRHHHGKRPFHFCVFTIWDSTEQGRPRSKSACTGVLPRQGARRRLATHAGSAWLPATRGRPVAALADRSCTASVVDRAAMTSTVRQHSRRRLTSIRTGGQQQRASADRLNVAQNSTRSDALYMRSGTGGSAARARRARETSTGEVTDGTHSGRPCVHDGEIAVEY